MDKMKEAYEGIFVHDAQIYPRKLNDLENKEADRAVLLFNNSIDIGIINI